MTVIARRFTIRWVNFGVDQATGYRVSIPNFDGGEVVMAEDYDALAEQLAGAVEEIEEVIRLLESASHRQLPDKALSARIALRMLADRLTTTGGSRT
jgi:hypothetical protein